MGLQKGLGSSDQSSVQDSMRTCAPCDRINVAEHPLHSMQVSPDCSRFLCVVGAGVDVWEVATRTRVCQLGWHSSVPTAAWSPDGSTIATWSVVSSVRLWNSSTGELVRDVKNTPHITCVAWSPDGATIAIASLLKVVMLINSSTDAVLHTLEGHTAAVTGVEWCPDGHTLATAAGSSVRLWNSSTGALLREMSASGLVTSFAWSPESGRLAAGLEEGEEDQENFTVALGMWTVSSGEFVRFVAGHERRVSDLAWSQDGSRIATASLDCTARLCSSSTGECVKVLEGHTDALHSVAWLKKGTEVLTASWDRAVCIHTV